MEASFRQSGDTFVVGNGLIEREYAFRDGRLVTTAIGDPRRGRRWPMRPSAFPELYYDGLTGRRVRRDGREEVEAFPLELADVSSSRTVDSIYSAPHLEVVFTLTDAWRGLTLRRRVVVYDGVAAVRSLVEVRSTNAPLGDFYAPLTRRNLLDAVPLPPDGGKAASWEFFTRSDGTNTFVARRDDPRGFDRGSLLCVREPSGAGLFALKEAPCFSDQRPEAEGNFFVADDRVEVLGWGIRPEEVAGSSFLRSYASVVGLFDGAEDDCFVALKRYQAARATWKPSRDATVTVNPWGEGNLYQLMGEPFVVGELAAAAEVGATHYQLDDGWESGNLVELVRNRLVDRDFWRPNPAHFPRGLDAVAREARRRGVEFSLWFCPSFERLYRNWDEQAAILLELFRRHGIRRFKIDGMNLRTKEAEDNLERLLRRVRDATGGEAGFDLDVTANPRSGYFSFQEYGNIFLENRYTFPHAPTYRPWLTLKNFWDLAPFVPAGRLQVEVLNLDNGRDSYPADDEFAPRSYPQEYATAVALFASPLLWFAPSRMRAETRARVRSVVDLHLRHRAEIHAGHVLPVGERPSGRSWTGLQSHDPETGAGFLVIYRERTTDASARLALHFVEGAALRLESLSDATPPAAVRESDGTVEVRLERPDSFRLYRYRAG